MKFSVAALLFLSLSNVSAFAFPRKSGEGCREKMGPQQTYMVLAVFNADVESALSAMGLSILTKAGSSAMTALPVSGAANLIDEIQKIPGVLHAGTIEEYEANPLEFLKKGRRK